MVRIKPKTALTSDLSTFNFVNCVVVEICITLSVCLIISTIPGD